jgi:2-polyprenyl-3-methyl-5-hydroxy-6-metoxy-1,4-benzoquinol methylase
MALLFTANDERGILIRWRFMEPSAGPCLICGAKEPAERFALVRVPFRVVQCRVCGFAWTDPPVSAAEIYRYYPLSYYGKKNRRFHPLMERAVWLFRARRARRLQRWMGPARALDVGCGRGHFLNFLRRCGWTVKGLELSEAAAWHARTVHGLDVHIGDLAAVDWPAASFDVVVFWHVLEHIADPRAALEKAYRLLRDGGLLMVAVPNFGSLQAAASGRHWFHLDIPRHYSHFSAHVLHRLLGECGFVIQRTDHFSVEQNIYGWLQSLYNRLGFRFNLLYNLLKSRSARDIEAPWQTHPLQSLGVVLLLPVLLPVSLLLFFVEVLVRRGGTIEVYARKRQGSPLPGA